MQNSAVPVSICKDYPLPILPVGTADRSGVKKPRKTACNFVNEYLNSKTSKVYNIIFSSLSQ